MNELLKVTGVCKGSILTEISFSMQAGEMMAVMGPSGSGKSTLLYNVSGLDRPDAGEVLLNGTDLVRLSEEDKARLRLTGMGFVFQQMNMLANLNIIDNIALPAVHADRRKKRQIYDRARRLMAEFHIEDLAGRRVNEVSGGQLQRACICRSMIMDPDIIFADEPTGALNQAAAAEVIGAFLKLNRKGTSVLMVTHDSKIASLCDRILYLLDGAVRGELTLGKYAADDAGERERKTARWLEAMGW